MKNSVVYTAISRGYDALRIPPPTAREARFTAFLEAPTASRPWEVRKLHGGFQDPLRNAKIHKVLPHRYFPDAACSLWMDGSVAFLPTVDVDHLLERFFATGAELLAFPHRNRKCLYAEAAVCAERNLDDPEIIRRQTDRYRREGYPENAGLGELGILFRRHCSRVREFNDLWWREIAAGSRRDQISFNYAVRASGVRLRYLPLSAYKLSFHRANHTAARPAWSSETRDTAH